MEPISIEQFDPEQQAILLRYEHAPRLQSEAIYYAVAAAKEFAKRANRYLDHIGASGVIAEVDERNPAMVRITKVTGPITKHTMFRALAKILTIRDRTYIQVEYSYISRGSYGSTSQRNRLDEAVTMVLTMYFRNAMDIARVRIKKEDEEDE